MAKPFLVDILKDIKANVWKEEDVLHGLQMCVITPVTDNKAIAHDGNTSYKTIFTGKAPEIEGPCMITGLSGTVNVLDSGEVVVKVLDYGEFREIDINNEIVDITGQIELAMSFAVEDYLKHPAEANELGLRYVSTTPNLATGHIISDDDQDQDQDLEQIEENDDSIVTELKEETAMELDDALDNKNKEAEEPKDSALNDSTKANTMSNPFTDSVNGNTNNKHQDWSSFSFTARPNKRAKRDYGDDDMNLGSKSESNHEIIDLSIDELLNVDDDRRTIKLIPFGSSLDLFKSKLYEQLTPAMEKLYPHFREVPCTGHEGCVIGQINYELVNKVTRCSLDTSLRALADKQSMGTPYMDSFSGVKMQHTSFAKRRMQDDLMYKVYGTGPESICGVFFNSDPLKINRTKEAKQALSVLSAIFEFKNDSSMNRIIVRICQNEIGRA
eukprot:807050_1